MLEIKKLNVGYGDLRVLYDVDLSIKKGQIVVLIGSNAAGKSTLLKSVSRTISIESGNIIWKGEDLKSCRIKEIVEKGLIQIPEGRKLFPFMTVQENLEVGSYSKRAKRDREESINEVYSLFPRLRERKNQFAGSLSGGEQQMCAIGRAMMAKPELLMLDEPSLGLAPILVQDVFDIVKTLNKRGVTILLVEQNVQHSLEIADYAYVLENGKIVLEGKGQELLADTKLKKAYLGM